MRVKMQVSIASRDWSFQPGEIVDLPDEQARTWIAVGHASRVSPTTPLTSREINLRDLDAEEVLHHRCAHCERRARFVLENRAYCPRHFRAKLSH
jgi:hypothetical protein